MAPQLTRRDQEKARSHIAGTLAALELVVYSSTQDISSDIMREVEIYPAVQYIAW